MKLARVATLRMGTRLAATAIQGSIRKGSPVLAITKAFAVTANATNRVLSSVFSLVVSVSSSPPDSDSEDIMPFQSEAHTCAFRNH